MMFIDSTVYDDVETGSRYNGYFFCFTGKGIKIPGQSPGSELFFFF